MQKKVGGVEGVKWEFVLKGGVGAGTSVDTCIM